VTADPVTRAARRQNVLDRLAEHLTGWGCPPDTAVTRAGLLLHEVESHGWTLPTADAPPLTGRGSTAEGRARARRIARHTLERCTCPGIDLVALEPRAHPVGCPVRVLADLGGTATPEGTADPSSGPVDKIDRLSGVHVPERGLRHSDGTPHEPYGCEAGDQ